jgi:signal transduction histidine kinase
LVRIHRRQVARATEGLGERVWRLERLPLRAVTVRAVLSIPEEFDDACDDIPETRKTRSILDLDPGWAQASASSSRRPSLLAVASESSWWPVGGPGGAAADMMARLWRHSVALGIAARSLARDAGDPDPPAVARAGMLCRLGCWAVAALDPDWLVRWWQTAGTPLRRDREIADLGADLDDLGRRLAERWGCEPLVIDAVWLHSDHSRKLCRAAAEPERLAYIQEAARWVEQTPWSLGSTAIEPMPSEPRLRILIAEVQARCGAAFAATDATPHEEKLARQNARLRLMLANERYARNRSDRFLQALAASDPASSPEEWASRAALVFCGEPDVSGAQVSWVDEIASRSAPQASQSLAHPAQQELRPPGAGDAETGTLKPPDSGASGRSAVVVIPIEVRGRTRALVQLQSHLEAAEIERRFAGETSRGAWAAWAALVLDRARLEERLRVVVTALRQTAETEETRLEEQKLDSLSEFAAGAGHELNNPLAVVVGRAQLLLSRTDDAETARSLRIMINQAGRAHRILRDLMFVGRPPARRPRSCRPSELLRESVRDFQEECTAKGIRLSSEIDETGPTAWTDPDALRHLADIFIRNAVQATPSGGKIQVGSKVQKEELLWWFLDSGRGLDSTEAAHLFDPFYCGRQAGRGLGMGLPRAARIVGNAGGRIRWTSHPGQGTSFHVNLPLAPPEEQPKQEAAAARRPTSDARRSSRNEAAPRAALAAPEPSAS